MTTNDRGRWEQEWKLAEHVMSIGPDLALQAKMSYKFGRPEPPEIEMRVGTDQLEAVFTAQGERKCTLASTRFFLVGRRNGMLNFLVRAYFIPRARQFTDLQSNI